MKKVYTDLSRVKSRERSRGGFTLIELLLTMGIMVLLLAVAIPSFNNYGRYNELYQMAQSIKSEILETKNYALAPSTSRKVPGGDIYKIVFYSGNNGRYTVCEEPITIIDSGQCALGSEMNNAAMGSDYTLNIINPPVLTGIPLEIKYSILQSGKITIVPILSSGNAMIRLISNRISDTRNYVDITINSQTGNIEINPSWK